MSITSASGKKTKAKLRYLKSKKERRKNKLALVKEKARHASTVDRLTTNDRSPSPIQVDEIQKEAPKVKEKRPKKKPKIDVVEENIEQDDNAPVEPPAEAVVVDEPRQKSPTPEVALPSFPPPVLPEAPDKKTLTLQGLDKGLLQAEIVDSSRVEHVDGLDRPEGQLPVLSDKTKKRLKALGITELFAVQTALLPFLLGPKNSDRRLYMPFDPPRDVCASAPTGSGKTLAYVIPIVEIISTRIITRLRALIVLPTRDLVSQVQETFEAVGKGRGLKIGVATGQHSFSHEQNALIEDHDTKLLGGSSKVDILICTPGRLIDHLTKTQNFTLQHLRFLVIDEADRLLAQSFQDWLAQVLAAIRPPKELPKTDSANAKKKPLDLTDLEEKIKRPKPLLLSLAQMTLFEDENIFHPSNLPHDDGLAPAWSEALRPIKYFRRPEVAERKKISCQKLLFSATLTTDPEKIAAVDLYKPKYFVVQGGNDKKNEDISNVLVDGFAMPATLKEHMLVCESSQKPLMLFHLVHNLSVTNALVFTKSTESATRLVQLFKFFEEAWAAEQSDQRRAMVIHSYSGDLDRSERKDILNKFRAQKIDILVCSDLISRGIDISHVSHVVSYDVPVDMRKYVHRVGRTARAGRSGDAWTLVEEQEAHYFKKILADANHADNVKKIRVREKDTASLASHYQVALDKLKNAYNRSNKDRPS